MKSLLLTIAIFAELIASEQLLLVVSEDFDSSRAVLQRYEMGEKGYLTAGKSIEVNIGRNGLGWGEGIVAIGHQEGEPVKREGDGKAPAGIFELTATFGYASKVSSAMPYIKATADLICIDDTSSPYYNRITHVDATKALKSFEWMRRDDALYTLGVTVAHNRAQKKGAGSCIFLHIEKGKKLPTAGCTSMQRNDLEEIVRWLKPSASPLLIQIPRTYCPAVEKRFPGIRCP